MNLASIPSCDSRNAKYNSSQETHSSRGTQYAFLCYTEAGSCASKNKDMRPLPLYAGTPHSPGALPSDFGFMQFEL